MRPFQPQPDKVIAIVAKRKSPPGPRTILKAVLASLDDDKAENVVSISLKGKSSLADHMVVATGRSQRHVMTLAEHLATRLKALGFARVPVEGLPLGEWAVVDAGDVIVQLFQPEARTHYGIEKMWSVAEPQAKETAAKKVATKKSAAKPATRPATRAARKAPSKRGAPAR